MSITERNHDLRFMNVTFLVLLLLLLPATHGQKLYPNCNICNEGYILSNPTAVVSNSDTILGLYHNGGSSGNEMKSCHEIQQYVVVGTKDGLISPSLCNHVKETLHDICGCRSTDMIDPTIQQQQQERRRKRRMDDETNNNIFSTPILTPFTAPFFLDRIPASTPMMIPTPSSSVDVPSTSLVQPPPPTSTTTTTQPVSDDSPTFDTSSKILFPMLGIGGVLFVIVAILVAQVQ